MRWLTHAHKLELCSHHYHYCYYYKHNPFSKKERVNVRILWKIFSIEFAFLQIFVISHWVLSHCNNGFKAYLRFYFVVRRLIFGLKNSCDRHTLYLILSFTFFSCPTSKWLRFAISNKILCWELRDFFCQ